MSRFTYYVIRFISDIINKSMKLKGGLLYMSAYGSTPIYVTLDVSQ